MVYARGRQAFPRKSRIGRIRRARNVGGYRRPVGACAMGVEGEAVVDASLRVHSTANPRVAATSIMPTTTSGNTNAPTIVIAERAAELLRDAK